MRDGDPFVLVELPRSGDEEVPEIRPVDSNSCSTADDNAQEDQAQAAQRQVIGV